MIDVSKGFVLIGCPTVNCVFLGVFLLRPSFPLGSVENLRIFILESFVVLGYCHVPHSGFLKPAQLLVPSRWLMTMSAIGSTPFCNRATSIDRCWSKLP